MMNYTFQSAQADEITDIFSLYLTRIQWMNEQNIDQWNNNGYLECYPIAYYEKQQKAGRLYTLKEAESGKLAAAAVLYEQDDRWLEKQDSAYYIHNLVTALGVKGAGKQMICALENFAVIQGKAYMRLDCTIDNAFLNSHYESQGYTEAGSCQDGVYLGTRREKKL